MRLAKKEKYSESYNNNVVHDLQTNLNIITCSRQVHFIILLIFYQPFTLQRGIFSKTRRKFPLNLHVPWNSSEQTIAPRERSDCR